jgi:hypothetical protein
LDLERQKNKKLISDFDQMTQMMTDGGAEQKEFSDKNYQASVLQNQKLENKVKDLD